MGARQLLLLPSVRTRKKLSPWSSYLLSWAHCPWLHRLGEPKGVSTIGLSAQQLGAAVHDLNSHPPPPFQNVTRLIIGEGNWQRSLSEAQVELSQTSSSSWPALRNARLQSGTAPTSTFNCLYAAWLTRTASSKATPRRTRTRRHNRDMHSAHQAPIDPRFGRRTRPPDP